MSAPVAARRAPVALVGLGATGLAVARALVARGEGARIQAAVDADPAKAGARLAELVDGVDPALRVDDAVGATRLAPGTVAVLTTTSHVAEALPLVERLVDARVHVVSLCEELSYPWRSHPRLARALDVRAQGAGVSVLGTGANPGYAMDVLPLVLSSALAVVERVEVERTADLSGFGPLLAKFGFGLAPEAFAGRVGTAVVGHVGFEQTLAHLSARLGMADVEIAVGAPVPIMLAPEDRAGEHVAVPCGTVAAVEQTARASGAGGEIVLRERFGILRAGDELRPGDRVRVHGDGATVELVAPDGLDSKRTTIAVLANAVDAVADAPPGLLAMSDLPLRALAARVAGVPA